MAVVPESQEIVVEEFKSEDQDMAGRIAGPFNDLSLQLIQVLNKALTIDENMRGETRTFTFNTDTLEKTFKYNGAGTPTTLFIGDISAEPTTAIMPFWSHDGKGNVTVKLIGTLAINTDYNVTFIILARSRLWQ